MGLLAIFLSIGIALASAGYFLFPQEGARVTLENPSPSPQTETAQTPEQATDTIEKAEEAKARVEEKAAETVPEVPVKKAEKIAEPSTDASRTTETTSGGSDSIKKRLVSFGYGESEGRAIDTIVLHSSYNNQGGDIYSVDRIIDIWKSYDVAPHYVVDRKGNIFQLVEDKNISYHAGVSKMPDGRTNVNGFSIGIELINSKDDKYTDAQYQSLSELIAILKKRHGVKYVVGHDDIAPDRKTDPWNFDWKKLR